MPVAITAALAGSALVAADAAARSASSGQLGTGWRWVLRPQRLDLYVDRELGPSTAADPTARLTLLACGAALHEAAASLATERLSARIELLPPDEPTHIAALRASKQPVKRPPPSEPPPSRATGLAPLAVAARRYGFDVAALNPAEAQQLAAAAGRHRLPSDAPVRYAVLCGRRDPTEVDWIKAGEALGALLAAAQRQGAKVRWSLAAVELTASRRALRRLCGADGQPYLALAYGEPSAEHSAKPSAESSVEPPGEGFS